SDDHRRGGHRRLRAAARSDRARPGLRVDGQPLRQDCGARREAEGTGDTGSGGQAGADLLCATGDARVCFRNASNAARADRRRNLAERSGDRSHRTPRQLFRARRPLAAGRAGGLAARGGAGGRDPDAACVRCGHGGRPRRPHSNRARCLSDFRSARRRRRRRRGTGDMTTVELLAELRERDIRVWIEGETLRCRAPKGALTPELRTTLADRKTEILAVLQRTDPVKRAGAPLRAISRDGDLPLSFSQERLWFLDQLTPDSSAYTIVSSITFKESIDADALGRSLDALVRRHEALRTTFASVEGQPIVQIAAPGPVPLPVHDLRALSADERAARLTRIRSEHAERPFDLERGPLMRAALVRAADDCSELLIALHHIVSDRWSLGIVTNEVNQFYHAYLNGGEPPVSELPIQYVDFAAWQRERVQGGLLEEQLTYWRRMLDGELAVLDLPTDGRRPAEQTHRGAWETRVLSERTTAAVRALSRQANVTPFMIFLAAFNAVLHRYTRQTDILVGTPISGRANQTLEGVVGCF